MSDDDDDFMLEEDDEMIIGGDDEDNPFSLPSNSDDVPKLLLLDQFFQPQILQFNEITTNYRVIMHESTLEFDIPSDSLPSSLQMVCGFYLSPILIHVTLQFKSPNWKLPLLQFSATHPLFNQNYVGRPLVLDTIRTFFTSSYTPKTSYKSTSSILRTNTIMNFPYEDNQLLYLIMEITDSFLDIQDHCCICRSPLDYSVIKPTICHKKLCEVGFNEIGVGSSVAQEIRRDPYSADLLFSLFACSFHNQRYTKPAPPQEIMENANQIFNSLPSMSTIARTCHNDTNIIKNYGNESLNLLRWVILSNKSQLIHLPDELKLKNVFFTSHFMTLMADPRAEEEFQNLKKKNRLSSSFMWHGSGGDRWHSIVRNGLMNMSNKDCIHGAAYGPGIYLAWDYGTSMGYAQPVHNLYRNSMLGQNLTCIALCEVLPVKKFKDFGGIATLQDERALIVRFIFPISNNGGDGGGCSGKNISEYDVPKLSDVLCCLGKINADSVSYRKMGSYNQMYDDLERGQSGGKRKKRKNRNRK